MLFITKSYSSSSDLAAPARGHGRLRGSPPGDPRTPMPHLLRVEVPTVFNPLAPRGNRAATFATEKPARAAASEAARVLPSRRGSSPRRAGTAAPAASGETAVAAEPPPARWPPPPPCGDLPGERHAARPRGEFGGDPGLALPGRSARPPALRAPAAVEWGLMAAAQGSGRRNGRGAEHRDPVAAMTASPSSPPPLNTMGRP